MKKYLKLISVLSAAAMMACPLAACDNVGGEPPLDCVGHIDIDNNGVCDNCGKTMEIGAGRLVIDDITGLAVGKSRAINPRFTSPTYAEIPTYTFDGDSISITDGVVTALKPAAEVAVTARTSNHEKTFKVTTVAASAVVALPDVRAYIGYAPSPFDLTDVDGGAKIEYVYNAERLRLDEENRTVSALAVGDHTVEVRTGSTVATFTVACEDIERSNLPFNDYDVTYLSDTLLSDWKTKGESGKSTLFIGDSFFDLRYDFWQDFYTDLGGKSAVNGGVSGSNTLNWEGKFYDVYLSQTSPKNIVMNIGTNNIGDLKNDGSAAAENLQRMFLFMHSRDNLKDTQIYWFSVAHRWDSSADNEAIDSCNALMKEWCAMSDWITYVEVTDKIMQENLNPDKLHPKDETYVNVYLPELAKSGIVY